MSEPEGRGAAWTEEQHMSEPKGRGVAWTEERGTSDEGRRRLQAPRRRAGEYGTASRRGAVSPGLRSEERATREGGAFRRPGGEREYYGGNHGGRAADCRAQHGRAGTLECG